MVDDDEKDDDGDHDHEAIVSYVKRNSNFSHAAESADEVICDLKVVSTLYLKIYIFLFILFIYTRTRYVFLSGQIKEQPHNKIRL